MVNLWLVHDRYPSHLLENSMFVDKQIKKIALLLLDIALHICGTLTLLAGPMCLVQG